jgi:hypothetical protein
MDKAGVFAFLRDKRLAVVSTVHGSGAPEAALDIVEFELD